jgi:hypothetical protein
MTWLKYDGAPILIDTLATRSQSENLSPYQKPCGFWITDDSENCWRSWCLSERFGLENLTHKHEVDLDESRLLILRSAYEVEHFARGFVVAKPWNYRNSHYVDKCIDWRRVADQHSGIIITPYQWSLRLADGFSWYYGWGCASGCIWDASAIRDARLVEIDLAIASKATPDWREEYAA